MDKLPSAAELIDLIGLDKLKSLAIIGLSKNAGKTTSLNHLISAWRREGKDRTLALSSVGRDGENEDVVIGIGKPRIYLPKGSLIATSVAALSDCDALLDIRELTGIRSAMGEIVICRALSDGYVELAGPSMAQDLKYCEKLLRQEDADCLYIVDGALSRRSPAGGGLTEAVILAVSYGQSTSVSDLLSNVTHAVNLLDLPAISTEIKTEIQTLIQENPNLRALAFSGNNPRILNAESLLGQTEILQNFYCESDNLLFLRGAVTESIAKEVLKFKQLEGLNLVVEDGSRLFISADTLNRLENYGVNIYVLHHLSLRLVTFNPHTEMGQPVHNKNVLPALREELTVPVFNLGPSLM